MYCNKIKKTIWNYSGTSWGPNREYLRRIWDYSGTTSGRLWEGFKRMARTRHVFPTVHHNNCHHEKYLGCHLIPASPLYWYQEEHLITCWTLGSCAKMFLANLAPRSKTPLAHLRPECHWWWWWRRWWWWVDDDKEEEDIDDVDDERAPVQWWHWCMVLEMDAGELDWFDDSPSSANQLIMEREINITKYFI